MCHTTTSLRAVHGTAGDDPEADELVVLLLDRSAEFAALWQRHEITNRSASIKPFCNPLIGELVLDCQILSGDNPTERLVIFTPLPDSDGTEKRQSAHARVSTATGISKLVFCWRFA